MEKRVSGNSNVDKILIENFVALQRVLTDLTIKLDGLSDNISKLLELFEVSAKSFAEKDFGDGKDNKEVIKKLDTLLEQNKIIAKGLTLMHERDFQPKFRRQI